MKSKWHETMADEPTAPRWGKMMLVSLGFHLAIFSMILFFPGYTSTRMIAGPVYEVELVELPSEGKFMDRAEAQPMVGEKKLPSSGKEVPARRIDKPAEEGKPVVIAKRTIPTEKKETKEPEKSSSKLIDQALSKIERKKEEEPKKDPIKEAIAQLQAQIKRETRNGPGGSGVESGITIRMYRLKVEERIKSNWSYPTALRGNKGNKDLETVVLLKVKKDGSILETSFSKKSADFIFDQSVMKAIERSNPLPPFPEGYMRSHEEIEINFNLRDLEKG